MKKELLQRFINDHPELMKLHPDVWVSEFLDDASQPTGKFDITVRHEFVFDNRLIPETFEEWKVQNIMTGKFPKEFPGENEELPLWKWYSGKNYEKFVDNNLQLIRIKLNRPDLSKNEALDALTGDFLQHNFNNKKMEEKMRAEHEKNIVFFKELLEDTRLSFEKSDIYSESVRNNWWYSVTATGFYIGKPLIVGFNWGAGNKHDYKPRTDYPFEYFAGLYKELGSFKRTINFFNNYFPQALTGMQTNFCFFRSLNEGQISQNDLVLSLPLFIKYVSYVKPSVLISFSSSLKSHLIKNGLLAEYHEAKIPSGKRMALPLKGQFAYDNRKIDFFYLPHPNALITRDARIKAWEFCFQDK